MWLGGLYRVHFPHHQDHLTNILIEFDHILAVIMPRPMEEAGKKLKTGCKSRFSPWEPHGYLAKWNKRKASEKFKGGLYTGSHVPTFSVCTSAHFLALEVALLVLFQNKLQ